MVENNLFSSIMYIPFAVIAASFITIIITSTVTDKNSLSGLIGGYSGLLVSLFYIILAIPFFDVVLRSNFVALLKEIFPIFMTFGITLLLVCYLYIYFDKIASGEVSSYYNSFLTLSTIFLAFQISAITNAIYEKGKNMSMPIFTNVNYSLLVLFGIINSLIIITLGIILRYYSTQG